MKVYRFFAYLIAVEVVVQAAVIATGVFGLGKWIDEEGGILKKGVMDENHTPHFTGAGGFGLHGLNGTAIIPLIAIVFVIVSFFAKVPGGSKWAGIVFGLVVVQVVLGMAAHGVVWLAPLHAINAFALLGAAIYAGHRASVPHATSAAAVAA